MAIIVTASATRLYAVDRTVTVVSVICCPVGVSIATFTGNVPVVRASASNTRTFVCPLARDTSRAFPVGNLRREEMSSTRTLRSWSELLVMRTGIRPPLAVSVTTCWVSAATWANCPTRPSRIDWSQAVPKCSCATK